MVSGRVSSEVRCGSLCGAVDACSQSRYTRSVELVKGRGAANHAHHQGEGRSGNQRSGTRLKRPIVCAQQQTGNGGLAGNREVATGKEFSHGRQRVCSRVSPSTSTVTTVLLNKQTPMVYIFISPQGTAAFPRDESSSSTVRFSSNEWIAKFSA